ncbi:MAG: DUF4301 family protein [Bacteroidales bacterium]|nr:DUF4301 family protein [Bacteroidales bacterium]
MKGLSLSEGDLQQIESLGISVEEIEQQLANYRKGFNKANLSDAATIENGGICSYTDAEISHYLDSYQMRVANKRLIKFVPASGAASRMFKDLFAFSSTYFGVAGNFSKEYPEVQTFLENIRTFAFFDDLRKQMENASLDLVDYMQRGDYSTIINFLLKDQYLGYGSKPKALLKFHRYGSIQRTPLEEHIVEGAAYAKSSDGKVRLHFTVSPEHRSMFRKKVHEVKRYYEEALGVQIEIRFSEQKHYTDTLAVNEYNEPIRDEKGRLVFRPGGHGALLENLQECNADIIFIKNIDNVVPDWGKHTTIVYKKVLAGVLLELQEKIFAYIQQLKSHQVDDKTLDEIEQFAINRLHITLPDLNNYPSRAERLIRLLNRPIRVCGMVRNQGEPGGGPFYVVNEHGDRSLQIVETAQINRKTPEQESILKQSTHFNPVDLVCGTKDYRGRKFNLRKFRDPETGFISKKSKGATVVKSQELPGLWNGAMAHWITLFVEVPLATFNPVKTVNDLLRKEHLEN